MPPLKYRFQPLQLSTKYIINKTGHFCHFNPGYTGLFYVFCTSVLQQLDSRVNANHRKSHTAFKTTLISVSVTVTSVLGSRFFFFFLVPAFDSRIPYTPVVTLITETRDVTLGGREERKIMPTHYLPFSYTVHLHAERSISEPQEGVTIAAKGGSKLKGREWSSPISNKSLPRKRTERSAAGELITSCLAAEKLLRVEGLCWNLASQRLPISSATCT